MLSLAGLEAGAPHHPVDRPLSSLIGAIQMGFPPALDT